MNTKCPFVFFLPNDKEKNFYIYFHVHCHLALGRKSDLSEKEPALDSGDFNSYFQILAPTLYFETSYRNLLNFGSNCSTKILKSSYKDQMNERIDF